LWPVRDIENEGKVTTFGALVPTTSCDRVGFPPARFHFHCGVLALPEMELATVVAEALNEVSATVAETIPPLRVWLPRPSKRLEVLKVYHAHPSSQYGQRG
jgi:hypothetical protein